MVKTVHDPIKTFLIVDDEPKICRMLQGFFELRGVRALTAQTGQEGIEKLRDHAPDALVLDIRMPDMSGLDLLRRVRPQYPEMKIVMVTAFDDPQMRATALQLGADDYITKPLSFDEPSWARAFFSDT